MTLLIQSCHDPKELVSSGDPKGLLKLTAKIPGDDNSDNNFHSEIDYDNHSIVVVFPKNYPIASDELLPAETLQNIRLVASLSNNTVIEPALTTLDLTKTNYITVKNPQGERTQYSIRGEIRDYWECDLTDITLADGTSGILVDNVNNVIMLVTPDATIGIPEQTAEVTVSPHATIVPDITKEPFNFDAEGAKIAVVAQNGVDKKEYTFVKGLPDKLPFGIDQSSARLMWVKKLSELGLNPVGGGPNPGVHNGIAVTDKYVIINETGNSKAVVLDAKTGKDTGLRLDMNIIPNGRNTRMTSDDAGNIIVNSKFTSATDGFRVWVFKDLNDPGKEICNLNVYGAGVNFSIAGDITSDAIAYSWMNGSNTLFQFIIKDGVMKGSGDYYRSRVISLENNPWSLDIAPTSATNPDANYFTVCTAKTNGKFGPVLRNGNDNSVIQIGNPNTVKNDPDDASNWTLTSCDYKVFNNSKYFFYTSVHAQTFGSQNDLLFLMDVTGGQLTQHAVYFGKEGKFVNPTDNPDDPSKGNPLPYLDINSNYGAQAAGNLGCGGSSNDARLWIDPNGYYMYAYFMFANGSIGCVRVDCIKR